MRATSRQHFLPCVYLKQFSVDQNLAKRKSLIWRIDSMRCLKVSVVTQCAPRNFYSKVDPQSAEATFRGIEGLYGKIARKIWLREVPTSLEYYGLIIAAFDFHLRNAMYINSTKKEGIDAYRRRFGSFRDTFFNSGVSGPSTNEQFMDHIKQFWVVRLLSVNEGQMLITSDNPSLLFFDQGKGDRFFFVLPITPMHCAVVYDKRYFVVEDGPITDADTHCLNRHQIHHCLDAIYSYQEPSEDEKRQISKIWKLHTMPSGDTLGDRWFLSHLNWKGRDHLGFVQSRNS